MYALEAYYIEVQFIFVNSFAVVFCLCTCTRWNLACSVPFSPHSVNLFCAFCMRWLYCSKCILILVSQVLIELKHAYKQCCML